MNVLNEIGHGFREKTYERALGIEMELQNIDFIKQNKYKVFYKGHHIDDYIPDIEVPGRLIVELKTVDHINNQHIGQVINYLKVSEITAGLILNFAHPKLKWKKVVLSSTVS